MSSVVLSNDQMHVGRKLSGHWRPHGEQGKSRNSPGDDDGAFGGTDSGSVPVTVSKACEQAVVVPCRT